MLLFSSLVVSDSLQPHVLQHFRHPFPSQSPRVCPSSCPLHWWCHPATSPSDALFSFFPQNFPASQTFPMSWLFTSDDQNTGASASVLPKNIQGWFPLRLTDLISLLSKGLLGVFCSTTVWRHQHFGALPSSWSSSHNSTRPLGTIALTIWTFVDRVMSLLFITLSLFIIAFLPRSTHIYIILPHIFVYYLLLHWNIYCLNSWMFICFTYYCRTITYRIMPGSTDTPLIHLMDKWMNDTNYGKLWGTQI